MTKSKLLDLADRVEALEGPDRSVDIEIWATCLANQQQLNSVEVGRALHGDAEADFRADRMSDGRRFTASLDSAMSLVPEGWLLATLNERNASGENNWRWKAELWDSRTPRRMGDDAPHVRGLARNAHDAKCAPALALTAACLRARAQAEEAL